MLSKLLLVMAALLALLSVLCLMLTQPTGTAKRQGPRVSVEAATLERLVRAVAVPRDYRDTATLDRIAALISQELQGLGLAPTMQTFTAAGRTYRNVHVLIGDPSVPRVVVGAHYDSCEPLPAADDNASGVAVVLELARLFAQHRPPSAVELSFWPLEEPPFFRTESMGSFVHAQSLAQSRTPVKAMLSIESVGYFRTEPGSQHFAVPGAKLLLNDVGEDIYVVSDFSAIGLLRTVKRAMRSSSTVPVRSITAPKFIPGVDWSDHQGFLLHGFPAVMITDTAPNRNPNYHQPTDTPDTLDYPRMAQVAQGLFEAVWALASSAGKAPNR